MSQGAKTDYLGPLTIDISPFKDDIVDLPPGGMHGLKREKDGFSEMLSELQKAKPKALGNVGISQEVVTRIEDRTAKLEAIRQKKAEAEKMAEVLRETEAHLENAREGDITIVARGVQATVQQIDAGLEASFEMTLHYYSQIGDKAAATRKKNAKPNAPDEGQPGTPK
jgi:predicted CopG family antitoxin